MDDKTDNCCDELLAMAKEAGISESQFMPGYIHATMANIERFHTLAVAKEREECATTAENVNGEHYMADSLPEHIAELIRARSAK